MGGAVASVAEPPDSEETCAVEPDSSVVAPSPEVP
jgi:hypothetical protein